LTAAIFVTASSEVSIFDQNVLGALRGLIPNAGKYRQLRPARFMA
jgi:hypothetical protein